MGRGDTACWWRIVGAVIFVGNGADGRTERSSGCHGGGGLGQNPEHVHVWSSAVELASLCCLAQRGRVKFEGFRR